MNVNRIFLIPGFRERIAKSRFRVLKALRNKFIRHDDISSVRLLDYSQSLFKGYSSIRERVDFLVSALGNTTRFDAESKLLVLGPRYESEIFGYMGLGFKKSNIAALDTFSYSRMITPGNIHDMPYSSNEFDIIMCGWTLVYSEDLEKAVGEINRVLKVSGVLIFTFDLREGENICGLSDLKIPNWDKPIMKVIEPLFQVRNWFIGKTSWSKQNNICCLALEKR